MLAYLAEKIAEEAPTRNWDGPDAECDSEDDEETELCSMELQEVWCRDGLKWETPCAVVLALRGAGTALLRSAYPDAVVQGVLALENRLLHSSHCASSQLPSHFLVLLWRRTLPQFADTPSRMTAGKCCSSSLRLSFALFTWAFPPHTNRKHRHAFGQGAARDRLGTPGVLCGACV